VEHVAHHLVLVHLDHARIDTLFEAGGDFFLGHHPCRIRVDAQQLEDGGRRSRQQ